MQGDSGVVESSGDGTAATGSNSGEEEREEPVTGGLGGKRWPRQETLALLKIRSQMDAIFRDSTYKAPLWEEISRKLAELGYNRSAKKCREKFENVYKYHKRTKDGRPGKPDAKTYRFSDQLLALENLHSISPLEQKPQATIFTTTTTTMTTTISQLPLNSTNLRVSAAPSSNANSMLPQNTIHVIQPTTNPTLFTKPPLTIPDNNTLTGYNQSSRFSNNNSLSYLFSNSTSSSTASDEVLEGKRSRKKRKHWRYFFKRLTKEMIEKNEEMQKKFLETLEKREKERLVNEESWRVQETARINREHEILVRERSVAIAKDAAIVSFLQKVSGHQHHQQQQQPEQQYRSDNQQPITPIMLLQHNQKQVTSSADSILRIDNRENIIAVPSSRWPQAEVEALISLRTNLDLKYHEVAPKGPLWEEISAGMRRLGYNRNSKRCKEKWENINKYFKKAKESNKKRPEDSKTCSYFHQLDAVYKEKNKNRSLPLIATLERQFLVTQENADQSERQKAVKEKEDHKDGDGGEYKR